MIQLGISAFYHDSAACIVKNGKVIAAAEEERFTEIKHDDSFPTNAINWCMQEAGIEDLNTIDEVCWYEDPKVKKDRVLTIFNKRFFSTFKNRFKFLYNYYFLSPKRLLDINYDYKGKIKYISHHLSHAAFSYYTSPYDNAAILTVDGVGEWETITISHGVKNQITKNLSINFPNSLGMLYSTVTSYLGFKPNEGEYKVMGLAPFGNPNKYFKKLDSIFNRSTNKFTIDQQYFTWEYSDKIMYNFKFAELLRLLPRLPEEPITQDHKDLAAALQKVYEKEFLRLLYSAKKLTGSSNLCLGGGCAYNGVANILAYKHFDSVHIPFAPSDAGSAIGACLESYKGTVRDNVNPYLGPKYKKDSLQRTFKKFDDKIYAFKCSEKYLIKKIAKYISEEKIIALFKGNMEFGARALGNRSIIASPKNADMRIKLNKIIKKREGFRPFAPSVTLEKAKDYFEINEPVPYMNIVAKNKTNLFEAATHIDRTCRVQTVTEKMNPNYYKLLKEVGKKTGHEVLLNTSYNLKDQTITRSPYQAIERFLNSDIDILVINNYLIKKK
jgi:carbamoyltransferase